MIRRKIVKIIKEKFFKGKIIQLLGPRQVGKSTLLTELTEDFEDDTLWLNGDESDVRDMLSNTTSSSLKNLIGSKKIIIIDEAQRIHNIGVTLKLFADNIKNVQVIATGSSAFELANKINEPLTGRKYEFFLFPVSFGEMVDETSLLEEKRLVEHRLIYGYYPEIVSKPTEEREHLKLITSSYLYKDLFDWQQIKKPALLENLLQALALQLGNEVSYLELAQLTRSDNETVERYINLLEKAFVIFRLGSLSRNLRSELKRSRKIYFWDVGVRNAIIKNFNPLSLRQDSGALWENFLIVERIKANAYASRSVNHWFWRTHAQQEIDYIEEANGKMEAFEIKWNNKGKNKFPKAFTDAYADATTTMVDRKNFTDFILHE
jgi:predicted AAA+ superfamily ATPase